jgi:hypothetical protein
MKEVPVSGILELRGGVRGVHRLQKATMFYVGLEIHDNRIATPRY